MVTQNPNNASSDHIQENGSASAESMILTGDRDRVSVVECFCCVCAALNLCADKSECKIRRSSYS